MATTQKTTTNIEIKKAEDVKVGDQLVERDGTLVTVAEINPGVTVSGSSVEFVFEQGFSVRLRPLRLRYGRRVRVLKKTHEVYDRNGSKIEVTVPPRECACGCGEYESDCSRKA